MRHKRIRFEHLQLNGVPVDVRYGDLLVAQDECAEVPDWEVVVFTTATLELEMAPYDVHMETVGHIETAGVARGAGLARTAGAVDDAESVDGEPFGQRRQLWGSGLLVRSDGRAHVFRGGGPLHGFSADELDPSGEPGR